MRKMILVLLAFLCVDCATIGHFKIKDYNLDDKAFADTVPLPAEFDASGYLFIKHKDSASISFFIFSSKDLKTGERGQTFCRMQRLITLRESQFTECVCTDDKDLRMLIYFRMVNKAPTITILVFYSHSVKRR